MGISLRFLPEPVIWQVSQEVAGADFFGKRLVSLLSLWLQLHKLFPVPEYIIAALVLLLLGSAWASSIGSIRHGRSFWQLLRAATLEAPQPQNPASQTYTRALLLPLLSQSQSGLQQNSFLQLKAVIFFLRQLPTSVHSQTCSNQ